MRFHLDEHVPHAIAAGLRLRGIDATTATDAGLLGASDGEHIQFAVRENRVILTNEVDFVRSAKKGAAHRGIAFCDLSQRRIGQIVEYLWLMHECMAEDEMINRIEYL